MNPNIKQAILDDLNACIGQDMMSPKRQSLLMQRLPEHLVAHLQDLRAAGVLPKIEMRNPDRVAFGRHWNDFVETGETTGTTDRFLLSAIRTSLTYHANQNEKRHLGAGDVERFQEWIIAEFENGFAESEKALMSGPRSYDQQTGEEVFVTFKDWQPKFWFEDPAKDYERIQVDLAVPEFDLVHVVLPGREPIWFMSGRGAADERITNAFYQAHIEKVGLTDDFNGHDGKLRHAAETYAATGVMHVALGDHFPRPILETATGAVHLIAFGQAVTEAMAAELEAEQDEDWLTGFFVVEDTRFDMSDDRALEHIRIASQSHLVRLLSVELGISEESAMGVLEDERDNPYGKAYSAGPFGEEVHLYVPRGGAVEMADKFFRAAGHVPFRGGSECAFILSPVKLAFPEGAVVEFATKPPGLKTRSLEAYPAP